MPSACVIAGELLDAGFELALACDYRVVIDRTATMLGFPEMEWGMIPCWGGTQRLPHLIGLDNSLQMLLAGQQFDGERSMAMRPGGRSCRGETMTSRRRFSPNPVKRDWSAFPHSTWRERWLESNRPGRWFLFRGAERILHTRIPDEMPAPGRNARRHSASVSNPIWQAGLDFERRALERIVDHPALRHLLRLLATARTAPCPIAFIQGPKPRATHRRHRHGHGGDVLALHSVTKGYEIVLRASEQELRSAPPCRRSSNSCKPRCSAAP